ncbi:hypothetical protein ACKX2L_06465 [Lachnospiraceae bacterium YH-ros2228]
MDGTLKRLLTMQKEVKALNKENAKIGKKIIRLGNMPDTLENQAKLAALTDRNREIIARLDELDNELTEIEKTL